MNLTVTYSSINTIKLSISHTNNNLRVYYSFIEHSTSIFLISKLIRMIVQKRMKISLTSTHKSKQK